jgi:3-hydroxyisobutyrate dehydrogenase
MQNLNDYQPKEMEDDMNSSLDTSRKPVIGWIGLGKMGIPMSKNLIKAGYKMAVYDLFQKRAEELACGSVIAANSPEHAAAQSDVTISIISDDTALLDVALGPKGVLKAAKPGSIFMDMSTVSAGASRRVAEEADNKGVRYLRAPVSGSTVFAGQGTLTVMASGPKDSFDYCGDIFRLLSKKALYVGSGEEARYIKLLINMMVGISAAMTAEALTFGQRGGLDWDQMLDIIDNSVVGSPLIGFKVPPLKERDFTPAFTAAQMCKDFDIALDTGKQVDAIMPLTALVRQFLGAMKARGKGELDYFGLVTLWEDMANIQNMR